MTPSNVVIFLKGDLLRIYSVLEVILDYFSPSLVFLNFLELFSPSLVCLEFSGFFIIVFSCVRAWLEYSVLVDIVFRLVSNFLCLFPFLFSFIVDLVPFIFVCIPCRLFSYFVCIVLICQHLDLFVRDLSSDVCFIWI